MAPSCGQTLSEGNVSAFAKTSGQNALVLDLVLDLVLELALVLDLVLELALAAGSGARTCTGARSGARTCTGCWREVWRAARGSNGHSRG